MIAQLVFVVALVATASAGIATSYAIGGIGLGGLEGGVGLARIGGLALGGVEDGLEGGLRVGRIGGIGLIGKREEVVDLYAPPKYEYKYGVEDPKTGDRKEKVEVREGDVVRGEYSLVEPDGTIRVVKYTADDKNGFNAVVKRIGKAVHPQILLTRGKLGLGLDI